MTNQEITNSRGQINKTIENVEQFLDDEEFKDFCDAAYTCITYLNLIKKRNDAT